MRRILPACTLALVLLPGPAMAQWAPQQVQEFLSDCVSGCQQNPHVHESRRAECPTFCQCYADEAQKLFSTTDFDTMNADAKAGRDTPAIQRFRTLGPICNRRVFGS